MESKFLNSNNKKSWLINKCWYLHSVAALHSNVYFIWYWIKKNKVIFSNISSSIVILFHITSESMLYNPYSMIGWFPSHFVLFFGRHVSPKCHHLCYCTLSSSVSLSTSLLGRRIKTRNYFRVHVICLFLN